MLQQLDRETILAVGTIGRHDPAQGGLDGIGAGAGEQAKDAGRPPVKVVEPLERVGHPLFSFQMKEIICTSGLLRYNPLYDLPPSCSLAPSAAGRERQKEPCFQGLAEKNLKKFVHHLAWIAIKGVGGRRHVGWSTFCSGKRLPGGSSEPDPPPPTEGVA